MNLLEKSKSKFFTFNQWSIYTYLVVFGSGIPKPRDPGIFGHFPRFPGIKTRETGKIAGTSRDFDHEFFKSRDWDFREISKHYYTTESVSYFYIKINLDLKMKLKWS